MRTSKTLRQSLDQEPNTPSKPKRGLGFGRFGRPSIEKTTLEDRKRQIFTPRAKAASTNSDQGSDDQGNSFEAEAEAEAETEAGEKKQQASDKKGRANSGTRIDLEKRPNRQKEAVFLIKNALTGQEYDTRNPTTLQLLTVDIKGLPSTAESAWQDWWKQKKDRNTNLLLAAEAGDVSTVADLLNVEIHGDLAADIEARDCEDCTALHYAARHNNVSLLQVLIQNAADVNAQSVSLRTPLHIACIRGYTPFIDVLMNAEADPNIHDCDGNTPIHILAEYGWDEALAVCLRHNPNLTVRNKHKQTALGLATNAIIRKLLSISHQTEDNMGNSMDSGQLLQYQPLPLQDVIDHEYTLAVVQEDEVSYGYPRTDKKLGAVKVKRLQVFQANDDDQTLEAPAQDIKTHSETPDEISGAVGPGHFAPVQLLGRGSHGEVYSHSYPIPTFIPSIYIGW